MVFNSLQFAIFFAIVYLLYRLLKHRNQNRMLLIASYVFYGSWDWRFLSLIIFSTIIDFLCGRKIDTLTIDSKRKFYLGVSVITNLTILGLFKYFNFFAESLTGLATQFNLNLDYATLNIILPVGISFYTFQTMSYTIDIYREKIKHIDDPLDFALFVAFFPQLVAGPIERASHLIPQIRSERTISSRQIDEGLWLILWGLFKKIFIADNLAMIVDAVFAQTGIFSGGEVLMASYAFAFQIYGDFSGYSDIARGISKLMGFDIMVNFRFPYFVTNPRDFWRNWHISLSTWLRDYLYIPLGGSRGGKFSLYRNLMITMFLGGLWHGAAWTFVLWGLFHGGVLSIHRAIFGAAKGGLSRYSLEAITWYAIRAFVMFHITCFGWILFRAESFGALKMVLYNLFFNFSLSGPIVAYYFKAIVFYCFVLLALQALKNYKDDMYAVLKLPLPVRWAIYIIIYYLLILFGEFGVKQFIYFQF